MNMHIKSDDMAPSSAENEHLVGEERRQSAAKWAVHAHYARLLGPDGSLLDRRGRGPGFDAKLVKDIAREYWVTRSIPGVRDGLDKDHHRNIIASAMKNVRWNDNLVDRARQCKNIAESVVASMETDRSLKERQKKVSFASAMTKLSWFLKPEGWTLYDKYANYAVTGKKADEALDSMVAFYVALEKARFANVVDAIDEKIQGLGIALHAGKIIDHYLMACCSWNDSHTPTDFCEANRRAGETLSRRLLPCARKEIDEVSIAVADILLGSALVKSS